MAANRLTIQIEKGKSQSFQVEMAVASGTTATIAAGSPTKVSSAKAAPMVDADGTTSQLFSGISKGTSTETSSAAGIVQLWYPVPGMVYQAKALVATAADTQAEIDALVTKRVYFDLTSSNWTVDSAQADATANCVVIIGGNPNTSELLFTYAVKGTPEGNVTT